MAYKSGADGVTKSGKTKGKQLGIDGKKVGTESGGKGSKGVTNDALKSMGRNLARVANQG
jgi:hypothetical protein